MCLWPIRPFIADNFWTLLRQIFSLIGDESLTLSKIQRNSRHRKRTVLSRTKADSESDDNDDGNSNCFADGPTCHRIEFLALSLFTCWLQHHKHTGKGRALLLVKQDQAACSSPFIWGLQPVPHKPMHSFATCMPATRSVLKTATILRYHRFLLEYYDASHKRTTGWNFRVATRAEKWFSKLTIHNAVKCD